MVTEGRHQSHETKSTFDCCEINVPEKPQDIIKTTLTVSRQNYDNDNYIIDLDSPERAYWLGTESGLLGAFHFG